jgi:hypothetical protein
MDFARLAAALERLEEVRPCILHGPERARAAHGVERLGGMSFLSSVATL